MTSHDQVGFEAALTSLSQLYPDLRFGQLIELVAVLAGDEAFENPSDIDDARLLQTAISHISHRRQQLGSDATAVLTAVPPARLELIRLLRELQKRSPGWRFGHLVSQVAGWGDVSLYDAEDEQLLVVGRQQLV